MLFAKSFLHTSINSQNSKRIEFYEFIEIKNAEMILQITLTFPMKLILNFMGMLMSTIPKLCHISKRT